MDDDDRRLTANRARRVLGLVFHGESIRHRARNGKVRRASCSGRSRGV
jgi:hypothetical protein